MIKENLHALNLEPNLFPFKECTVKSLYNISSYNTDLDITWSCCGSQMFYNRIFQRNYRKMTVKMVIFH